MKLVSRILIVVCSVLCLQACSRGDSKADSHLFTVQKQALSSTLYYSGIIQPLHTMVIPSPADGIVVEMPHQYGEPVKMGELLFRLSSAKFLTDYKSALTAYIKAKSDFNNGQTQLSEAQFLHKNQLISDDEFKLKQSSYYAAQLTLLQAKDALELFLSQLDIKDINLYKLNIADIEKITQAMHLKMDSDSLKISSPVDGVILAMTKGEEDNKKIGKGDAIKQGDVLAVIGDMSGLSVRIKVNELVINQLKVGQRVQVTGIAFPEEVLQGEITRVDRQGDGVNSGLPTFAVEVAVKHLSDAQQQRIHPGMSAKVEINLQEAPQISIPINAITEKNGESFVNVYDPASRHTRLIGIRTGKTSEQSVSVLSGLSLGDKIVLPD